MKLMKLGLLALALTVISLQLPLFAQDAAVKPDWVRLQINGSEMSLEMPADATRFADLNGFVLSEGFGLGIRVSEMQLVNAAEDKTLMWIESYQTLSPRDTMSFLIERSRQKSRPIADLPKGVSGKEVELTKATPAGTSSEVEISFVTRYYATKKYLYIVTAACRGKRSDVFTKFLASVRFKEANSDGIQVSSLQTSTIDDIAVEPVDKNRKAPAMQKTEDDADTTPLLVLTRPFAAFTVAARSKFTAGEIILRPTFEKTGRISKIELVEGLPNGLNRTAFFAALRIKYLPPEKDGIPQTTVRNVSYSFSIG